MNYRDKGRIQKHAIRLAREDWNKNTDWSEVATWHSLHGTHLSNDFDMYILQVMRSLNISLEDVRPLFITDTKIKIAEDIFRRIADKEPALFVESIKLSSRGRGRDTYEIVSAGWLSPSKIRTLYTSLHVSDSINNITLKSVPQRPDPTGIKFVRMIHNITAHNLFSISGEEYEHKFGKS